MIPFMVEKVNVPAGVGEPRTSENASMGAMLSMKKAATEFLTSKRVAVTGVSANPKGHGSNAVYKRLRDRGYMVFAVNPNAETVEGDPAFRDLSSIPGGVDSVVIGTRPESAEATMRECDKLGISQVWMHRLAGGGSVSPAAAEYGRTNGILVIEGGCPLMFDPTADIAHKCLRFFGSLSGAVPKQVG
jgi:predicted CoA-binding protein